MGAIHCNTIGLYNNNNNPDKSDAIFISTAQHVHSYTNLTSVNVAGTTIPLASNISILCTKLDSNLTLDNDTKSVSWSCFYDIRALRQIRGALDNSMAATIASLPVWSLDYVNLTPSSMALL